MISNLNQIKNNETEESRAQKGSWVRPGPSIGVHTKKHDSGGPTCEQQWGQTQLTRKGSSDMSCQTRLKEASTLASSVSSSSPRTTQNSSVMWHCQSKARLTLVQNWPEPAPNWTNPRLKLVPDLLEMYPKLAQNMLHAGRSANVQEQEHIKPIQQNT
jgi:hypothetical protein